MIIGKLKKITKLINVKEKQTLNTIEELKKQGLVSEKLEQELKALRYTKNCLNDDAFLFNELRSWMLD